DAFLNFIVDNYLLEMSNSEFKIYVYVYRQTIGANLQMTSLSLSRIIKETGLTRNTVLKALKGLEKREYIRSLKEFKPHTFMLNYSKLFTGNGSIYGLGYFLITEKFTNRTKIDLNYPEKM
ncbi:MAG TPA: hypothetical protein DF712_14550, partial [Balneola sp.]|nr:hypothetical protein [Balneola sp.]